MSEDQFSGDFNVMLLIDNTARKVPITKIDIDTPYLKGQVEEQFLPDAAYDLIIGNVPGARAADDPDPSWQGHVKEECAVTMRSQAKKAGERIPLKVPGNKESPVVDREKLEQMQCDDESLQKYWERNVVVVRGQAENSFEVKGGVLYHVYKHPYVDSGKPLEASYGSCAVEKSNNGTSSWIYHERSHGNKKRLIRFKVHSIRQVFKET